MLDGFLLVVHVLASVLIILVVLMQSEQSMNISGMFGGASQSALGSRPGSVLAKTTVILGIIYALISIYFAITASEEPLFQEPNPQPQTQQQQSRQLPPDHRPDNGLDSDRPSRG